MFAGAGRIGVPYDSGISVDEQEPHKAGRMKIELSYTADMGKSMGQATD